MHTPVRLESVNREILPIPLKEDILSDFTIAETTPELVYFGESASNSQRLYSVNLKKKSSVCLKDLSAGILKDITLGEVHDWNFRAAAGDTIYGRYYLPPHFDPNKKYPLIVNYYGGTSPTERSLENRYPSHVYAALGYIVYIIQPSGATGFGQEFSARHVNAWGQRTGDEIIEGTKKFCAEHNFVDAKKIGCIGASYGGFMTQYLQTKTDIFAAAISHAGISTSPAIGAKVTGDTPIVLWQAQTAIPGTHGICTRCKARCSMPTKSTPRSFSCMARSTRTSR